MGRLASYRAFLVLGLALALSIPGTAAHAAGTIVLNPTSTSYTDTSARDSFNDLDGAITVSGGAQITLEGPEGPAGPSDGARGDATITYTHMANSSVGRMYVAIRDQNPRFLFAPDNDAINALGAGANPTAVFTFGEGATFTVRAFGINDRPVLTLAARSDITAALPRSGSPGFVPCGTSPGSGDPYQIPSGTSPSGEACHFAFDGTAATKYLNFGQAGSGVLIDTKDDYVVTGLHLTTANDSSERDPTSFTLQGSNDALSGPWNTITSGALAPPFQRFTDYPAVTFGNATTYRYYKLVFNTVRSTSANSMQVASIRFSGALDGGPALFAIGGDPVAVEPRLELWDDSAALSNATVSLPDGQPGDVLSVTIDPATMGSIVATWDPAARRLTLTGSATPEQYQAALRAVRFSTTSGALVPRTVEWRATDTQGLTSLTGRSQVVVVGELPPPPNPVAVDDSATVAEDAAATTLDVRANDTDADGGPMVILSATDPANGTVRITNDGEDLTYQPDADYCNNPPGTSPDTFSYALNGGSTATVSVTVTCADVMPVAVNDSVTVGVNASANTIDVLANDTDPDGGPKSITSSSDPANGTVAVISDGRELTYQPDAGYCNDPPGESPDTFTYTINGGSTATVSITVTCADVSRTLALRYSTDTEKLIARLGSPSPECAVEGRIVTFWRKTPNGPKSVAERTTGNAGMVRLSKKKPGKYFATVEAESVANSANCVAVESNVVRIKAPSESNPNETPGTGCRSGHAADVCNG